MTYAGLMTRRTCDVCGMVMRACNLARHKRYRHDPDYVRPSRTKEYRAIHRHGDPNFISRDGRLYRSNIMGTLYIVHLSAKVDDHAGHYMGWTSDLSNRLREHARGRGSALLRYARDNGITFALTWTAPGTRTDERRIKKNRKLAHLCSLCRRDSLAAHATRQRNYLKGKVS